VGSLSAKMLRLMPPRVEPRGCSPLGCEHGVPMSIGGPSLDQDFPVRRVSIRVKGQDDVAHLAEVVGVLLQAHTSRSYGVGDPPPPRTTK
jgi:hypothetical protein